MMRSLNEVAGLAAKAARGAGAPPAQAADFGQATLRHLCAGRAADDLAQALRALPEGPIIALPLALAQVVESGAQDAATGDVAFSGLMHSYVEALPYAAIATRDGETLCLHINLTPPERPDYPARVELPDALADLMTELAARTLVPESDASRAGGAGAGLTDND